MRSTLVPKLLPLLALLFAAGLLRFHDLPNRVMHTDEAVHAVKVGYLLAGKPFEYDPSDYHGPTLHYLAVAAAKARGQNQYPQLDESTLRGVTAAFGVLLVLVPFALRRELGGTPAAVLAACLTAFSPIFVFYSRYFIMEMLFVVFLAGLGICLWKWAQSQGALWLAGAAVCLGLLHATKETFVIHFGAMVVAGCLVGGKSTLRSLPHLVRREFLPLVVAAIGAFLLSSVLLSHGFRRPEAVLDGIRTYLLYFQRAEGVSVGHEAPWFYYFDALFGVRPRGGFLYGSLAVLLLAIAGGVRAFLPARKEDGGTSRDHTFLKALTLYTCLTALAYGVIPYKTPWSFLGTTHGILLLAGSLLGSCLPEKAPAASPPKWLLAAAVVGFAGILTHHLLEIRLLVLEKPGSPEQPYVYGHTDPGFRQLVDRLDNLENRADRKLELVVAEKENGWPLPWYRRHALGHNRYGNTLPTSAPAADAVVVDREWFPTAAQILLATHQVERYPLRPGVNVHLFLRRDLENPETPDVPRLQALPDSP